MTPKEKAQNIVSAIYRTLLQNDFLASYHVAKELSLIAVDEVFEFMKIDDEYTGTSSNANSQWVNYYEEVRNEIQKL
jgi:hypothetical protein